MSRYGKFQRDYSPPQGNLNLGLSRLSLKSNIGYQNAKRTSKFFEEVYYALLEHFGQQGMLKQVKKQLKSKVVLLDSTLMSLCISMYDWALYTRTREL